MTERSGGKDAIAQTLREVRPARRRLVLRPEKISGCNRS